VKKDPTTSQSAKGQLFNQKHYCCCNSAFLQDKEKFDSSLLLQTKWKKKMRRQKRLLVIALSFKNSHLKLSCDERFTHAFTACGCVFKEITLVGSNQGNYFENATTCSKRMLKTRVATQLNAQNRLLLICG
jgi:hypothetical protein